MSKGGDDAPTKVPISISDSTIANNRKHERHQHHRSKHHTNPHQQRQRNNGDVRGGRAPTPAHERAAPGPLRHASPHHGSQHASREGEEHPPPRVVGGPPPGAISTVHHRKLACWECLLRLLEIRETTLHRTRGSQKRSRFSWVVLGPMTKAIP